jgi:vancomycin resistance protein YoaR
LPVLPATHTQNYKNVEIFLMTKIIHRLIPFTILLAAYTLILTSSLFLIFEKTYENKAYPQTFVAGVNVSGMTQNEIQNFFNKKSPIEKTKHLIFKFEGKEWATNTDKLEFKFDSEKMAEIAIKSGRTLNPFKKITSTLQTKNIKPEYSINEYKIKSFIGQIQDQINVEPEDALFTFDGIKVSAFKLSKNGLSVNDSQIKNDIWNGIESKNDISSFNIKTVVVIPKIQNENSNNLGIKELIGSGISYFPDSIPSRIFNINLASAKFNGVLIKPGEVFSFLKTVGNITKLEGYKEAYVISEGKTVLGDGGGVCQVSTTIYRAALFAGLPIVERTAHAYRVHYYEPPIGFDATIYQPSGPDLKFKNDTGHYILIQTIFDPNTQSLTFNFYGTSDGRVAQISDPTILSTSPAPDTKYQDDPTLPKGIEKQIDTAHDGAKVFFTRRVLRGNKILIDEKIWSNYIPWAAVILRGTK